MVAFKKSKAKKAPRPNVLVNIPQQQKQQRQDASFVPKLVSESVGAHTAQKDKEGRVKLSLDAYLALRRELSSKSACPPPTDWLVISQSIDGVADSQCARLTLSVVVNVLADGWSTVPLYADTLAVSEIEITNFTPAVIEQPNTVPSESESDDEGAAEQKSERADEDEQTTSFPGFFGVLNSRHTLVAWKQGVYEICVKAEVPYKSDRKRGVDVTVPRSSRASLTFTVPEEDVQISVSPSIHTHCDVTEEKHTIVHCNVPPTSTVSLQWTAKVLEVDEPLIEKEKHKMMVTAEQQLMCTIGEGVLASTLRLNYSIMHGAVTILLIEVRDADLRVLRVTGTAVKRWKVLSNDALLSDVPSDTDSFVDIVPQSEPASGSSVDAPLPRLLKVWLDYDVEGDYRLTVTGEKEMGSTSARVSVPQFACRGVAREKGFAAISAKTNVEIEEKKRGGVTSLDPSELPRDLRRMTSTGILYAYKFLNPDYSVVVDVTKHADVAILEAVIENAWLETTYADGQLMHRTTLSLRNTQRQYVRVSLPDRGRCEIWSTLVNGRPVKPADDASKRLMIPVQHARSQGDLCEIECVYVEQIDWDMEKNVGGTVAIKFPQFDLPVNRWYASVYLPRETKYGEFEGNVKEVRAHSAPFASAKGNKASTPASAAGGARAQVQQQQMQMPVQQMSNMMMNNFDIQIGNDDEDQENDYSGLTKKGLLPVKINSLRVGREFRFERMLVKPTDAIHISAPYRTQSKGFFAKRRVGTSPFTVLLIGGVVAVVSAAGRYWLM